MITWKGWGILGLVPLLMAIFVFGASARWGIHHRGDGRETGAAMILIATGLWWLGRRMNGRASGFFEARHSLYLIPLQFYAIPLFAAGAFLAVATWLAPA